jgi:formylglycine-generating enzyme required for sulfatase activity
MRGHTSVMLACCATIVSASACDAPADAAVLVDLSAFANSLPGLRAPAATLDVVDDDGNALPVEVDDGTGKRVLVQSPIPVPCDDEGLCSIDVRVRPAVVRFAMHVTAGDRCNARAELVRLDGDAIELKPHTREFVDLSRATFAFDDDDDGLDNVFELATCGRFDVKDGAAPPQACAPLDGAGASDPSGSDGGDPCCAEVSPLEGHMTAFAGGEHVRADGSNVDVAPFALDATEVTWRQLARCVAAGACLFDQPEHPVRAALATRSTTGASAAEPVVGLNPSEAQALCEFFGKRLPLDDEWDFAAAHRAPASAGDPPTRGRYPWGDDDASVTCDESLIGAGGVAANFSIPGTSCPGAPVAVASFASSHANDDDTRGVGGPLADLGGNVAEWTLVAGALDGANEIAEVPSGHDVVVLRGGGARSPLSLLENDLPVRAVFPASGDANAWRDVVVRLATTAGVRCAKGVDDGTVAPVFEAEPACGEQP